MILCIWNYIGVGYVYITRMWHAKLCVAVTVSRLECTFHTFVRRTHSYMLYKSAYRTVYLANKIPQVLFDMIWRYQRRKTFVWLGVARVREEKALLTDRLSVCQWVCMYVCISSFCFGPKLQAGIALICVAIALKGESVLAASGAEGKESHYVMTMESQARMRKPNVQGTNSHKHMNTRSHMDAQA